MKKSWLLMPVVLAAVMMASVAQAAKPATKGPTGCAAGDSVAPTVNVVSPTNGATTDTDLSVVVNAVDSASAYKVYLHIDGVRHSFVQLKRGSNTVTFNAVVSVGAHQLTVTAVDACGNFAGQSLEVVNIQAQ